MTTTLSADKATTKTTTFREIAANTTGWGWARLLWEDETGRVVILSDYGHWSYCWPHIGDDSLPAFLAKLTASYMGEKLLGSKHREHSDEKTIARIRKTITEDHKTGSLTDEEAAEELQAVDDYENGWSDFRSWCGETSYDCPHEMAEDEVNGQWCSFWDHLWFPIIKPALEAIALQEEQASELQAVAPERTQEA